MDDKRVALFKAKIAIDQSTGCWLWTAHVNSVNGYGQFWNGERVVGAHVFSYETFNGPLPDGHEPDHTCRTRRCVNPAHLEAVTRRENLLRGDTIPARKAGQTECLRGHPFTPQNTYRGTHGTRACRTCRALNYRNWAKKNRPTKKAAS